MSTTMSRRRFLSLAGQVPAGAALAAAPALEAQLPRPRVAWQARISAQMPGPDLGELILSRLAYGATAIEREDLRLLGPDGWLEAQLRPADIGDETVDAYLAGLSTLGMSAAQLLSHDKPAQIAQEMQGAAFFRLAYSRRRVQETLVEFWSDHFSIDIREKYARAFKTVDDREVIRPLALDSFRRLLTASAHSPAMLSYLDNDANSKRKPNENYAREIMELHSLGAAVNGYPYTEKDVKEVARCFTGWTYLLREANGKPAGSFVFQAGQHDTGAKQVLGQVIPAGGGQVDGDLVIDLLCRHQATPRYVGTKLLRRLVCDEPQTDCPELLDRVAAAWGKDGSVPALLRLIVASPEFQASFGRFGGKLVRPLDQAARMLRVLGWPAAEFGSLGSLILGNRGMLAGCGQLPFYWPTPDGYPDIKEAWVASAPMIERWNLALALCGASPSFKPRFLPASLTPPELTRAGQVVDYWIQRILGRPMLAADRATVVDFLTAGGSDGDSLSTAMRGRLPETLALILDSPYFLWR